jgi:hypothetical protein
MATNKRKESAALFELIDKSTLKVPKSSGSLKIPSWWSSKTNPATAKASPAASPPQVAAPPPLSVPATTPEPSRVVASPAPVAAHAPPADVGTPAEDAPVQHRLFDPPPPNVTPPTSPSIRPPMAGAAPVHMAPAISPPKVEPKAPEIPPLPKPEHAVEAPPGTPAPRVFAPQTYAQDRKPWSPPRPGAFARLPMWAIVSAVAVLAILVCVVVFIAQGLGKTPRNGNNTPPPVVVQPGKLYEGGTVARSQERYYIIVCSTPAQTVAQNNAGLLLANGIDCSIERVSEGNVLMFMLVSVQGFSSNTEAQLFLKKIQEIGNRANPNPFKDARPRNGLTSPGTTPARSGTR